MCLGQDEPSPSWVTAIPDHKIRMKQSISRSLQHFTGGPNRTERYAPNDLTHPHEKRLVIIPNHFGDNTPVTNNAIF